MLPCPVELRAVSKTYTSEGQPAEVLHGDFAAARNRGQSPRCWAASGCGKTTLLNLAGAMDFPTPRRGADRRTHRPARSRTRELTALRRESIGFVFQLFQLLPTLTALENVELPLLLAGAPKAAETARDRLRWVGLEDKAASYPYQLSGGQMQRVAIARALVHSPRAADRRRAHRQPR